MSTPQLRFTWLSDEDEETLRALNGRDWSSESLTLGSVTDEQLAAHGVALGAVACHAFANLYAISAHPAPLVVRYVNELHGQNGGVTTTREHIESLFDWSKLPSSLTRRRVIELIDTLFGLGPFGFRGPAARDLPAHLTVLDGDVRTIDLLGAGYRCPSYRFVGRSLTAIGERYLYVTSAHGARDEAPHFRMDGVQREFGAVPGVVLLAHPNEERARRAYFSYQASAPTVVALHRVARGGSRPVLRVERHGSLGLDDLRLVVASLGFDVELAPGISRAPVRDYDESDSLKVA